MNALKAFGIGIVSLILIIAVVVGGYNMIALALGTVTLDYFMGGLAVLVLVGGGWLATQELGFIGKPFMVVAILTLLVIGFRHRAPGVATFIATASAETNRDALIAAAKLSEGQEFQCDRTTPNIKFFDYVNGEKRRIAWTLLIKGRFTCFTRPGVNPLTGEERLQIDEELAKVIREQDPPPTPSPPIPKPQPAATPIPELGDRPVPTPIPEIGDRPSP